MHGPHVPVGAARQVLDCIARESLPHGREDSFKLAPGECLTQRLMVGVRMRELRPEALQRIVRAVAMPSALEAQMRQWLPRANVLLLGAEQAPGEATLKVYLEFWDKVREAVLRTGSREPRLLNLGFKWRAGAAEGRVARYTCHPMLGTSECLSRLDAIYGDADEAPGRALAAELIARCARAAPRAAFVYMEVEEDGTPRRSFDINLYQAALPMSALGDWLGEAVRRYALPAGSADALAALVAPHVLGHVSGGVDRHGRDFLTVYYEIEAL